jgi:hypothetical protein
MTKYIVELGINIFGQGVKWSRSNDLPAVYESREEAQRAIDNYHSGCTYRVTEVPSLSDVRLASRVTEVPSLSDVRLASAENKLRRIQEVLNSKTKAEQIQNILNEGIQ